MSSHCAVNNLLRSFSKDFEWHNQKEAEHFRNVRIHCKPSTTPSGESTPKHPLKIFFSKSYGLDNVLDRTHLLCQVKHGSFVMGDFITKSLPKDAVMEWNEQVVFDQLMIDELPRESQLVVSLVDEKKKIAVMSVPIFDCMKALKQGEQSSELIVLSNPTSDGILLHYSFQSFETPIIFDERVSMEEMETFSEWERLQRDEWQDKFPSACDKNFETFFNRIIEDPLRVLSSEEKIVIWLHREHVMELPEGLPLILQSVPWNRPQAVSIVHNMIENRKIQLLDLVALEMLSQKFVDSRIRKLAVLHFSSLSDNQLERYLLQLFQALQFEVYHDSELSRFVIERALASINIGNGLFWHLKSLLDVPHVRERSYLLLEEFLNKIDASELCEYEKQVTLVKLLEKLSQQMHLNREMPLQLTEEDELLSTTRLPLSPDIVVQTLIPSKCKIDSKYETIFTFQCVDQSEDVTVLFIAKDNHVCEMMILQIMKHIEEIWSREEIPLHFTYYPCICTSFDIAMRLLIPRSTPLSVLSNFCERRRMGLGG